MNNVLLCLCNSIKSELEDIDSIISRLKSEYNIITYPGEEKVDKSKNVNFTQKRKTYCIYFLERENLQNKERGVCCQLCFIVTILTNLSNISLSAGNLAESVFKNLMSLFCTLTSLAKYFTLRSTKLNVAFQGARYISYYHYLNYKSVLYHYLDLSDLLNWPESSLLPSYTNSSYTLKKVNSKRLNPPKAKRNK